MVRLCPPSVKGILKGDGKRGPPQPPRLACNPQLANGFARSTRRICERLVPSSVLRLSFLFPSSPSILARVDSPVFRRFPTGSPGKPFFLQGKPFFLQFFNRFFLSRFWSSFLSFVKNSLFFLLFSRILERVMRRPLKNHPGNLHPSGASPDTGRFA